MAKSQRQWIEKLLWKNSIKKKNYQNELVFEKKMYYQIDSVNLMYEPKSPKITKDTYLWPEYRTITLFILPTFHVNPF